MAATLHHARVGFVGVGFMGKGMAKNIMKKHNNPFQFTSLTVFDSQPQNTVDLAQSAVAAFPLHVATSATDVAKRSDVVCLSLPSEDITRSVLFGPDGLVSGFAKQNSYAAVGGAPVVVDHGTFSRAFVLDCHARAQDHGVVYVDAPVSGGPAGAAAGTLTIMLGGDERVCDTLRPLLDCYASKVLHFGPVGSGMAAKLVNQALVCVHAQAAAEAIYLAEHMGLLRGRDDAPRLLQMLQASWGQSRVLELALNDYIAAYDPATGTADMRHQVIAQSAAPLRNLAKDMHCVTGEMGGSGKVQLPLMTGTSQAIDAACSPEHGLRDKAFVSLLELIKRS